MPQSRFLLLLKRCWFENRRTWLIGTAAIAVVTTFLLLLAWHWRTSFNGDTVRGIFLIMLFAGGGIFMSGMLNDLGDKHKGIWLLNLPASAGAKLAVAGIYGIVGYLAVYFGIFFTTKAVLISVFSPDGNSWGELDLLKNNFYEFLFIFIDFQLAVLLGSVYFNKNQLLKTLLVLLGVLFVLFNGNGVVLAWMTGEASILSNIPMSGFQFAYRGENIDINTPAAVQAPISILMWVLVPITLWLISLFRLKEKEL